MNTGRILSAVLLLLLPGSILALGPEAESGKRLYPACHVCHDQTQNPPQGPPMWGVKRKYLMNSLEREDFVRRMVAFVKAPSEAMALHQEAVQQLGLMPPLPLPDEMLVQIAHYIFEEEFPPPCEHWRIAAARAEARGDTAHAAKDRRQLKRFCGQQE